MNPFLRKYANWWGWMLFTVVLASALWMSLQSEDGSALRSAFLPGVTTSGHHQIELACSTCHTSPYGGGEVLQTACEGCHLDELKQVRDSHPKSKFTDPANADRVAVLDARLCATCHREHRAELTHAMGVTVPDDVCALCHEAVGEERATHAGMAFDTCGNSGCHNFHDNTALYESFLVDNAGEPWLLADALVAPLTAVEAKLSSLPEGIQALDAAHADAPGTTLARTEVVTAWAASAHAQVQVNCSDCHVAESDAWADAPGFAACTSCHEGENTGFLAGKHGMRLAAGLTPMTPALARIPMHEEAAHEQLDCGSCHEPHGSDRVLAATDACQGCHASDHTLAYTGSPHDLLRQRAATGGLPENAAVTCATCHMPRLSGRSAGKLVTRIEHNQNANLRPSDKMLRTVCMKCHSLEFALDALADTELVNRNFRGRPEGHVESIDMTLQRREAARAARRQ